MEAVKELRSELRRRRTAMTGSFELQDLEDDVRGLLCHREDTGIGSVH